MSGEGADMDKLSKEMDRLQNAIEAANGWELDRVLDRAMDALRCPDGEALVANLSGEVAISQARALPELLAEFYVDSQRKQRWVLVTAERKQSAQVNQATLTLIS